MIKKFSLILAIAPETLWAHYSQTNKDQNQVSPLHNSTNLLNRSTFYSQLAKGQPTQRRLNAPHGA